MTRSCRLVLNAALGLLLASAGPAMAGGLRYLEAQRNLVNAQGLDGARGVAISPDGRHVYAASGTDDAVVLFTRDAARGVLSYVEAYRHDAAAPTPDGLNGAQGVTVSPDGKHVYVASATSHAVVAFARDADSGHLTWLGARIDGAGPINGLDQATAVIVTADGAHVYVAGKGDNAVAIFARDADTGLLAFRDFLKDGSAAASGLAGASALALSPDGAQLYVAASSEDSLSIFTRNPATGGLTEAKVMVNLVDGIGLDKPRGVAISPDGANVYVVGGTDDALSVFTRDPATGLLTFLHVEKDEEGGVNGLNEASAVAVSPDGTLVYATGEVDDAIAVFTRNPATGDLTFVERIRDNTKSGSLTVDGLDRATAVALSPDGMNVYVAALRDDAVSVFRKRVCGDGFLDAGEQCDDGNLQDGDCCAASCQADTIGTVCADDANACTDDVCDGAGACVHQNNTAPCDDGAFCTVDDTCQAGSCQGAARDCSAAGDQCNDGTCDETLDTCVPQAKEDGTACDDGDLCTRPDVCTAGACGSTPVVCAAADQCNDGGTCDPSTGLCPAPKADGTPCDDADACTRSDSCQAGACAGSDPVVCTAADQCHDAGTCDPATGTCSDPVKADGSPCNDQNGCTQSDTCQAGACSGGNPVVCTASDQCHVAGTCDPASGTCSNPAKADGAACDDGNGCTRADACQAGACTGSDPVVCAASDQCHAAGSCNPSTGTCSNPARPDGSVCDDGNADTATDACTAGICGGVTLADSDGDGIVDLRDVCPEVADADQADANGNGVGDACECTAPAPGRCIAGGGPAKSDCLIEFNPRGAPVLNKRRTAVMGVLRCTDGDASCDLDGQANGTCTFGVAVCLGNDDPRLACQAADVRNFEIMSPNADKSKSEMDRANALAFERTLGTVGLEIRRAGRIVTAFSAPKSRAMCSPLVEVSVPAPRAAKPTRRTFKMKGTAVDGRADLDRLTLECRR